MEYNRPHATATWGTMGTDWEAGVDFQKLNRDRSARAKAAVKEAGLGAVLCFTYDNIRYVTGTHIGEWGRDKFDRYALCPMHGIQDDFARQIKDMLTEMGVEKEPLGIDLMELPMLRALEAEGIRVGTET